MLDGSASGDALGPSISSHHSGAFYPDSAVAAAAAAAAAAAQRQKRMRTSFKHHQLRVMKSYFELNHNPDAKDLKQLSQKTGLSKRVLQVWFQNARAKFRRGQGGGPEPGGNGSGQQSPGQNSANASSSLSSSSSSSSDLTTSAVTTANHHHTHLQGGRIEMGDESSSHSLNHDPQSLNNSTEQPNNSFNSTFGPMFHSSPYMSQSVPNNPHLYHGLPPSQPASSDFGPGQGLIVDGLLMSWANFIFILLKQISSWTFYLTLLFMFGYKKTVLKRNARIKTRPLILHRTTESPHGSRFGLGTKLSHI